MARTGRPPTEPARTVTVRHIDTGKSVAWYNGQFGGDRDLVQLARDIHTSAGSVVIGHTVIDMTEDEQGAAAAMLRACAGRGEIVDAPWVLTDGPTERGPDATVIPFPPLPEEMTPKEAR